MKDILIPKSLIQTIFKNERVQLDVLREDLNHPLIQGNKLRKLKYNLLEANRLGKDCILTFGGAFSNHIYATAAAGKAYNIKTIGIIRGEELEFKPLNSTLRKAKEMGMELKFVPRETYRNFTQNSKLDNLQNQFQNSYILPEGGTNALAIKGCEEIIYEETKMYDFIALPMGTAGTISGILNAVAPHQKVMGFPALKNADFLEKVIHKNSRNRHYEIINAYHFGGYAKFTADLIKFVNNFNAETQIIVEPIYTGKMFYGILDLIENNYFPKNSKILAIHTGGLQGITGFNEAHGNIIL